MQVTICKISAPSASPSFSPQVTALTAPRSQKWKLHRAPAGRLGYANINSMEQR